MRAARSPRHRFGRAALGVSVVMLSTLGGCSCGGEGFTIVLDNADVYASWAGVRLEAFGMTTVSLPPPDDERCVDTTPTTISDSLQAILDMRSPSDTVEIIISYRDTLTLPYLPDAWNTTYSSATYASLADSLIDDVRRLRADSYETKIDSLQQVFGARITNWYWLIKALQIRVPAGSVPQIAGQSDVEYVSSAKVLWAPPQTVTKYASDGRAQIGTDPFFTSVPVEDTIAVFDLGVRSSHAVLANASVTQFNCPATQLPPGCNLNDVATLSGACFASCPVQTPPPDLQDCYNYGHGTSTTAILTGTAAQGDTYRGVTAAPVYFYRVQQMISGTTCGLSGRYVGPAIAQGCYHERLCSVGSSTGSVILGFQSALEDAVPIFVVQVQQGEDYNSHVSQAADRAYDAGAVVVVANGNYLGPGTPPPGSVRAPANAHKALGAGAYRADENPFRTDDDQTRGPTSDCRIKPDVQTPTQTVTAAADGDLFWKTYGQTSGSTPYLGGAAAILRTLFERHGGQTDPGFTYAGTILVGDYFKGGIDNEVGSGRLRMPQTAILRFRRVKIDAGDAVAIPIKSRSNVVGMDGAAWWPEGLHQRHNAMSLFFIDPNGAVVGPSRDRHSVFQRSQASSPVASGEWKMVLWNEGGTEQEAFVGVHVTKSAFSLWEKFLYWLCEYLGG